MCTLSTKKLHIHKIFQQHILHKRQSGQENLDLHLWRMLCNNCVHPFFPQLQNLVILRPHDDHLYCMVYDHSFPYQRSGKGLYL